MPSEHVPALVVPYLGVSFVWLEPLWDKGHFCFFFDKDILDPFPKTFKHVILLIGSD